MDWWWLVAFSVPLSLAMDNCYSCSHTYNEALASGENNPSCLTPASHPAENLIRPCTALQKFCMVSMVSLKWSFIGLERDCVKTCRNEISYQGFGLELETRLRCCNTTSACNHWNASSIYINDDWFNTM